MQEDHRQKVLSSFQLVLRPIVKILLRYGIGFNEFAEAVKTAFVDVATTEFGIRGRPTNISRVAVMSGLTRKEVRRLRNKIESGGSDLAVRTTPISEIVTRWHSEESFINRDGLPLVLPFAGTDISFTELVRRFGGDVPPGAMRTELKRMNLVEERPDGSLEIKSRFGAPLDSTDNLITGLVHLVYPCLSTVCLNSDPEIGPREGSAQFTAYSTAISNSDRKRLRRISYDRLSETAVSFDDLFATHEAMSQVDSNSDEHPVVSVGLFFFEETDQNAEYKW